MRRSPTPTASPEGGHTASEVTSRKTSAAAEVLHASEVPTAEVPTAEVSADPDPDSDVPTHAAEMTTTAEVPTSPEVASTSAVSPASMAAAAASREGGARRDRHGK